MPYIHTTTTVKLTEEKKATLAKRYGKAITVIPGKTETHLMLDFQGEKNMYLGGSNEKPLAFVQVKIFGSSTREHFSNMTAEICAIMQEELGIEPDGVYVEYVEATHWGWNGSNL